MEKTRNFTEGKILAPLIGFALPVLLPFLLGAGVALAAEPVVHRK